jgi:hypothetical protein
VWRTQRKTQTPDSDKASRVETLQRLQTVLSNGSSSAASDQEKWEDLELNPWKSSVPPLVSAPDDSPDKESETLLSFVSEGMSSAVSPQVSDETTDAAEVSSVEGGDQGGQLEAVAAFQDAVSEACVEAKTQLASVVATVREAAAEEHAAEISQIADRHAEELRQTRETVEAEVTRRVLEEESLRHAAELARLRDELERRYADDLRKAQSAVIDSLKGITKDLSESV